mmetsp:Transcript_3452/g.5935  ORF Transcript_3452/g.5935 Transcript_3452/m.5935 type:complete len:402 (-) Transcript_3452:286-1491(-)
MPFEYFFRDQPGLSVGLLLLFGTSVILIALRAFRVIREKHGKRMKILETGPWSVFCMVMHLVTGIYTSEYYASICANSGAAGPHEEGFFYFVPAHFTFRMGTSANFYFMRRRARLAEYNGFRSRAYKRVVNLYAASCVLHFFLSLVVTFVSVIFLPASYAETCDGEWIKVPVGAGYSDEVSKATQDLVTLMSTLIVFCETVATFAGLYLFWKPFRLLSYQTKQLRRQRRQNGSNSDIPNHWFILETDQPAMSGGFPSSKDSDGGEKEGKVEEGGLEHGTPRLNVAAQHEWASSLQSVLYWNLLPALLAQCYGFVWVFYEIMVISAREGINSLQLQVGHMFNIFFFVIYYNLVFRDHLWVQKKFREKFKKWLKRRNKQSRVAAVDHDVDAKKAIGGWRKKEP